MAEEQPHQPNITHLGVSMRFLIGCVFLVIVLLVLGCQVEKSEAIRLLTAEGCQDITLHGWPLGGCSSDDNMKTAFTCERNGQDVQGVICGQWGPFSKGYTIRWK